MNEPVLQVSNIGKVYREYHSEFARVLSWFGASTTPEAEHQVLSNISFSVMRGEAVGIIGRNGAGKSTLLKIITGTLRPTTGQVQMNGKVAAILELGMGFNPEFTGRENVYHAAGLMGYSRAEITKTVPSIAAFADIGDYFDQPVGIYSSGMQMRVTFALATAFKPQLLIVDEALSVGDAAFQRKCFRRIEGYLSEGMSLLLVSHDVEGIKKICSKALFLKQGEQQMFDQAKGVCDEYERYLFGSKKGNRKDSKINPLAESAELDPALQSTNELSYGDGRAEIENVWLENENGKQVNVLPAGGYFYIKLTVRFDTAVRYPVVAFLIKTTEGISLYGVDTDLLQEKTNFYKAGDRADFSFCLENRLNSGIYFLNCGIKDLSGETPVFLHRRVDTLMFNVRYQDDYIRAGLVNLEASFSKDKSEVREFSIN